MNKKILTAAAASYIPRIVLFLTGPIGFIVITKRFEVETLGAYNLILTTCNLATFVFTMGLQKYIGYAIPGSEGEHRYKTFFNVYFIELLLFLSCVFIFLYPGSSFIAKFTQFPLPSYWFWVGPALWVFFILEQRILLFFGMKKRVTLKVILGTVEQIVYTCGLIVLFFIGTTVWGVILSQVAAYIAVFLISLSFLNWNHLSRVRPDKEIIVDAFRYSMPLILVDASLKIMQAFDRFLISSFYSTEQVGLYAYAFNYMNMAYLFGSPLLWSVYPFFADAYRKKLPERNDLFKLQLSWTTTIAGFATLGLLAHSYFLIPLLSRPEYLKAGYSFMIFAIYPIVISVMYIYQQILLLDRETKFTGSHYLISAIINILLNLILVPRIGQLGAAISSLTAYTYLMIRFIIKCRGKMEDLQYKFLLRLFIGFIIWAGILYLIGIPGKNMPWLYLIGTMIIALPIAHILKLIDFNSLLNMFKKSD